MIKGVGIALRGLGKALAKRKRINKRKKMGLPGESMEKMRESRKRLLKPLKKSIERKVSRKLAAAGGAGAGSLPFTTKKK